MNHAEYGEKFRKILDAVVEEFGEMPSKEGKEQRTPSKTGEGQPGVGTPKRRGTSGGAPSPLKRPRLDASKIVPVQEIGDQQKLMECPLVNVRGSGVLLHIKMGNKLFLFNNSSAEVSLKRGLVLAGFGKGKYKAAVAGEELNVDKVVPYVLDGPDTEILMNGTLCTVGFVVEDICVPCVMCLARPCKSLGTAPLTGLERRAL